VTAEPLDRAAIAAECGVFARHLTDDEPTPYVIACYERLLPSAKRPPAVEGLLIERALLSMGRAGGVRLRMADGYACLFRPRGGLRRRLVLVIAILENSPSSARLFNSGEEGSFVAVSARMMASMAVSALCTLGGVLVFAPVHLASALLPRALHASPTRA
jgi:hypothetical protein